MSDSDDQKKVGAAPRRLASDEERTHLILDPICLPDDGDEGKEAAPVEPPTRLKPGAAGDARTQLMIGPLTSKEELLLKEAPMDLLPFVADQPGWLLGHTRRLGFWLEERLQGRWGLVWAAAGLVCGILAPLIDQRGDEPGSAATVLASFGLLLALVAFGLTWLSKLQTDERHGLLWAIGARLRGAARLLALDIRELGHSPLHLKAVSYGRWLAAAGLLGLSALSAGSVMLWLSELHEPPNAVRWLSGSMLLLGLSVARFAARSRIVAPTPEELEESVAAATKLAAIVDLSESLPPSFINGYAPLHRVLIALTQWRGPRDASPRGAGSDWPDEAGYRAALERHFQRQLPASKIEREKWLGRSRADGIAGIVIDDMVLIDVARGFHPTSAARAIARLSHLARTWRGKPMILTIFEASREPVFQSAATASLIELHERFPLLTVRMPVASEEPGAGLGSA